VPLLEDPRLLEEITTVVQDILACRVSASFALRLRAAAINPFLKEGTNKIRPITPESVWLKVASHVALDAAAEALPPLFDGWQYGVGGDAAVAVAKIRAAYERDENTTLVALDATNAYNSVSRRHILGELYKQDSLRYCWGIAHLALGKPGHLGLYEKGQRVAALESTCGIRQGMVLGPLIFSTALIPLRQVARRHPAVSVVAYLDDITVVGPRQEVQAFLHDVNPLLQAIGFSVNPTKSVVLSKAALAETITIDGAPITEATTTQKILGAGFHPAGSVHPSPCGCEQRPSTRSSKRGQIKSGPSHRSRSGSRWPATSRWTQQRRPYRRCSTDGSTAWAAMPQWPSRRSARPTRGTRTPPWWR